MADHPRWSPEEEHAWLLLLHIAAAASASGTREGRARLEVLAAEGLKLLAAAPPSDEALAALQHSWMARVASAETHAQEAVRQPVDERSPPAGDTANHTREATPVATRQKAEEPAKEPTTLGKPSVEAQMSKPLEEDSGASGHELSEPPTSGGFESSRPTILASAQEEESVAAHSECAKICHRYQDVILATQEQQQLPDCGANPQEDGSRWQADVKQILTRYNDFIANASPSSTDVDGNDGKVDTSPPSVSTMAATSIATKMPEEEPLSSLMLEATAGERSQSDGASDPLPVGTVQIEDLVLAEGPAVKTDIDILAASSSVVTQPPIASAAAAAIYERYKEVLDLHLVAQGTADALEAGASGSDASWEHEC
mmetsp:Transcript_67259/g.161215  ORF Transcript_67259/g.161215 Transcript_67259/m.161215 type:complete len:371 (-) Transcript_67259:148-1260(-)